MKGLARELDIGYDKSGSDSVLIPDLWRKLDDNPQHSAQKLIPVEVLAYIYAVLYSPTYRERYYEFLKYDFPRIPLPRDIECVP